MKKWFASIAISAIFLLAAAAFGAGTLDVSQWRAARESVAIAWALWGGLSALVLWMERHR